MSLSSLLNNNSLSCKEAFFNTENRLKIYKEQIKNELKIDYFPNQAFVFSY